MEAWFWIIAAAWLMMAAVISFITASVISRQLHKVWGIPTRHWQSWYVSLATFCVIGIFNIYGSGHGSGDWRMAEIDRTFGWLTAGAILAGHAAAYWFVNSRPPKDSGQKED